MTFGMIRGTIGLLIITAVLFACKKEGLDQHGTIGVPATPLDVTPRVKQFVDAAKLGNTKSGSTFTADSAVWYLEAALNYSAAQPWLEYTSLRSDSLLVQLDLSGGSIEASTLYDVYNDLYSQLENVNSNEQHLHFADVIEAVPNAGQGEVLVYYQVASGYAKGAPNNYYPPGYVCVWTHTYDDGYCDSDCYGADHEIADRINQANIIGLQPGQYLHSIETWQVSYFPTFPQYYYLSWRDPLMESPTPDNGGYRETLLFSTPAVGPPNEVCLDADDMTYWTGNTSHGTWKAILNIQSTYCPTKLYTGGYIVPDNTTYNSVPYYYHAGFFSFGLIGNPDS